MLFKLDVDSLLSLENVAQISKLLKKGINQKIYLPIDVHVVEYSKLKKLIKEVPEELQQCTKAEVS